MCFCFVKRFELISQLERKNELLRDHEVELKEKLKDLKTEVDKYKHKYSVIANKGKMTARLNSLEEENNALLDYVKDTLEPLKHQNETYSSQLQTTSTLNTQLASQMESKTAAQLHADETIDELTAKLLVKEVEVARAVEERESALFKLEALAKEVERLTEFSKKTSAGLASSERKACDLEESVKG